MVPLMSRFRNAVLPFAVTATAVIALSIGLIFITNANDDSSEIASNPTTTPAVLGDTETPAPTE